MDGFNQRIFCPARNLLYHAVLVKYVKQRQGREHYGNNNSS